MLLKIGAGFLAVSVGLTLPAAVAVHQHGIAMVRVQEKSADGVNLTIPVPMALVNFALNFVPPAELQEVRREIAPHRELLKAVLKGLAACPDATFVDVRDHDETVRVSKHGGYLEVYVNSHDERVDVEVPLNGVSRLVEKLAAD